ncbi:9766_t:CDS:1, partial [Cetraspora pellucida]
MIVIHGLIPFQSSTSQSFYPPKSCIIFKSRTIIRNLLADVLHNGFWNGNHLILDRDNVWLVDGYIKVKDFEEFIEVCYSYSTLEVSMELRIMFKELANIQT